MCVGAPVQRWAETSNRACNACVYPHGRPSRPHQPARRHTAQSVQGLAAVPEPLGNFETRDVRAVTCRSTTDYKLYCSLESCMEAYRRCWSVRRC